MYLDPGIFNFFLKFVGPGQGSTWLGLKGAWILARQIEFGVSRGTLTGGDEIPAETR